MSSLGSSMLQGLTASALRVEDKNVTLVAAREGAQALATWWGLKAVALCRKRRKRDLILDAYDSLLFHCMLDLICRLRVKATASDHLSNEVPVLVVESLCMRTQIY